MPIIEAQSVVKKYKTGEVETTVLNSVSLSIEKGDFVSVIGKSGAGKSTLLYVLSGLEPVTSGHVILDGTDLTKLSDKRISFLRRNNIGFVFQFYNLIESFTAEDNISFPLELNGKKKSEIDEKIQPIIELMGLSKVKDHYPYQMSGGEQQRVSIARALAIDPEIIFADEPTGNLDSKTSQEILNLLKMINTNFHTTILMVTHDMSAAEIGNRIIKIADGQIIE
ncbi:Bacitracin export ATP-binding protein BceA [[Clostridium] cellulosi]|uniref:Bacitracin export ATP-binding protein BceA n=1 Tax=[Clostridium] cellulosi TaxID=29343 RepID=A0A078KQB6_9FIRM|nr:Bacitracin export ATP-binding protein BceA [[Clostridium] cellulosi]